jgi:hypothetical protein
MQEFDTVVAVTSGTSDMQAVMNLVWDRIVPALGASALPADPESDRRLSDKLAGLSLRTQAGMATSPLAEAIAGKRYQLPSNPQQIEAVCLEPAKGGADAVLTLRIAGADQRIPCGLGAWAKGSITLPTGESFPAASSGAWSSDDTYSVTLYRYQTPFSTAYDVRFAGNQVFLEAMDHVGLVSPERIRLVGSAQP